MLVSGEMSERKVQKKLSTLSSNQNPKNTNENKSSPRKRKHILDNLKSDLSPKYIGDDILRTNFDENFRALRKNRTYHEEGVIADKNGMKITPERIIPFESNSTPSSAFGISVRRISGDSNISMSVAHTKEFISPIDKLLLSNGSKALLEVNKMHAADLRWFIDETKRVKCNEVDDNFMQDHSDNYKLNDDCIKSNTNVNEFLLIECNSSKEEPKLEIANVVHSPSTLSLDSGKGSSVIGLLRPAFVSGDICWGQIYNFCYWPCIVFPDPEGKTITTLSARNRKQNVVVHVRFFADHGRRNWVKRENLISFEGLDVYKEYMQKTREQFGEKSNKFKLLLPSRNKIQYWHQAIQEAESVACVPLEERLEAFDKIQEESRYCSVHLKCLAQFI